MKALYHHLASNDLDIFLQYHPKINKLKKEAKALLKDSKKKYSLMQCQEIIAKKHGYSSWYHMFNSFKNFYNNVYIKDSYDQSYNPQFHGQSIFFKHLIPQNNLSYFLIGKDNIEGYNVLIDNAALRTHLFLIGKDVYRNYDILLAKQMIEQNKTLFMFNGDNDIQTHDLLKNYCKENKRAKDLVVFNIEKNETIGEINHSSNKKLTINVNSLFSIIYSTLKDYYTYNEDINIPFSDKYIYLYINLICTYISKIYVNQSYNLKDILPLFSYETLLKLKNLKSESPVEQLNNLSINSYQNYIEQHFIFKNLSLSETTTLHDKIIQEYLRPLNEMLNKFPILNTPDIFDFMNIFMKNQNIILFQIPEKDIIVSLFLKNNLYTTIKYFLGSDITHEREYDKELLTLKGLKSHAIFRNTYSIMTGSMPSWARGSGLSITVSYTNYKKLMTYCSNYSEVIGNCNTKIVSPYGNDYETQNFISNLTKTTIDWKYAERKGIEYLQPSEVQSNNHIWVFGYSDLYVLENYAIS